MKFNGHLWAMEGARGTGSDPAMGGLLGHPGRQGVLLTGSAAEAAQSGVSPGGFTGPMLHIGLQGCLQGRWSRGPLVVPAQEGRSAPSLWLTRRAAGPLPASVGRQ